MVVVGASVVVVVGASVVVVVASEVVAVLGAPPPPHPATTTHATATTKPATVLTPQACHNDQIAVQGAPYQQDSQKDLQAAVRECQGVSPP